MTQDLRQARLAAVESGAEQVPAPLATMYELVEGKACESVEWYQRAKRSVARWSKLIRGGALAFAGAGALCPLMGKTGISFPGGNWDGLGYLLLAAAAALVAFDRFFGFSTAYARYMTTALALQRALDELHLDWISLLSRGARSETASRAAVERLKATLGTVFDLIDHETREWVAEFRSTVGELERLVQAERGQLEPGAIDVSVQGADGDQVELWVDAVSRGMIQGTAHAQLAQVVPGQHVVHAHRGGASPRDASALVLVPPGGVAATTLNLG